MEVQIMHKMTDKNVQISDTREFINTHLDEARNRIMRMSLVMEMCMLGVSTGAVISGIFGKFLTTPTLGLNRV